MFLFFLVHVLVQFVVLFNRTRLAFCCGCRRNSAQMVLAEAAKREHQGDKGIFRLEMLILEQEQSWFMGFAVMEFGFNGI